MVDDREGCIICLIVLLFYLCSKVFYFEKYYPLCHGEFHEVNKTASKLR